MKDTKGMMALMTPKLLAITLFMALGNVIYGYDTNSFGGVQAIPAFGKQFGDFDPTLNRYALPARTSSLLTSLAFAGKLIGTIIIGPCTERFGHRPGMILLCLVTIIGTIIQVTSKVSGQFLVGRIVVYIGVGIVENVVPTYQSEITPSGARGFVVGSLQMFLACGALVAAGVNRRYADAIENSGWIIPVSIQFVTPIIILCGLYFIPPSPRWLLFKGRREEAIAVLRSVRPKSYADAGLCEEEADAIEESMREEARIRGTGEEKLGWLDLFKGSNLRRTSIATIVFAFQQLTGQAFSSQYGTVFYIRTGLGDMAFTYSLINTALSIVVCFMGMILIEYLGRRPVLISGAFFQSLWLYLVAGIGGTTGGPVNADRQRMMVAATMLFTFSFSYSWAPLSYVVASEVGTGALREKTMAFSSMVNVVAAFAVSFTLPYLLNPPYANLQARVGYIYGSIAAVAMIYSIFFVPETKGRSLEELDELFERKPSIPAWKFRTTETSGVGAKIGAIEGGNVIRHTDAIAEESVEKSSHDHDQA
ncbi:general substrate transporter [Dendrothele bispora CBS 962.96]|uniref:General substrate transporter n=1 Tax=Dendrothele bispora (strain CBS 962.96) TaxID=1314807 RepID=A0A4S8L3M5_DENBC|nr:general substrate transporter [Dendrothele bispora CBS 962.96]THU85661.1 general substrate transporter [Dendrothele bispora CBS 962.96]